jgi:hypothetical protein
MLRPSCCGAYSGSVQAIILDPNNFFTTDCRQLSYRLLVNRLSLAHMELRFPRAHESLNGRLLHKQQGHGQSPKVSQAQQNRAESSRSCTSSPVRSPSSSRAVSPLRTFFDCFSSLGRLHSCEEPIIPTHPSVSTPLCRSAYSCDAAERGRSQHGEGDIEEAALSPQCDILCTC